MARSRFSLLWAVAGAAFFLALFRRRAAAAPIAAGGSTFKEGVRANFAPQITRILPVIEAAHLAAGLRAPIITSGTEGHSTGLHPLGLAIDLRTRDLSAGQIAALLAELRRRLGSIEYDVVDESRTAQPHIHIEYDPD